MRDLSRRWAWLGVLVVGLLLYILVLRTLIQTQNPNFVPALILLGATVVPLAFLTFAQARARALAGAGLGPGHGRLLRWRDRVVVAGRLEYNTLRGLGMLPMLLVALIEEAAR